MTIDIDDLQAMATSPFWERPRNISVLLAIVAVVAGVVGYLDGVALGSRVSQVIVIQMPALPSR